MRCTTHSEESSESVSFGEEVFLRAHKLRGSNGLRPGRPRRVVSRALAFALGCRTRMSSSQSSEVLRHSQTVKVASCVVRFAPALDNLGKMHGLHARPFH
jgi:hypothetical protein